MTAQPLPAPASGDPSAWDQALYAFLVEKGNRCFVQPVLARKEDRHGHRWPPASGRRTQARPGHGAGDVPRPHVEQARLLNLALNKISGSWDDAAPRPTAGRLAGQPQRRPHPLGLRRGRDPRPPPEPGDPREEGAGGGLRSRLGPRRRGPVTHGPSPGTCGDSATIGSCAEMQPCPRTWSICSVASQGRHGIHRPAIQRQPR
jgi:hypothetical protein